MLTFRRRSTTCRRIVAGAAALLLVVLSAEGTLAQRLEGRLAGGKYTSPRHLFTVDVPKARNWAGVPFSIEDRIETRDGDFDAAFFHVKDFGEVRIASVRRIPQAALDDMAASDPQVVARGLADKAILDWRQNLTERPTLAFDGFVMTHFGQTALRIYDVEKGSLLARSSGGRKPETYDVLVGVMAVKRSDHYIYAIAEDDLNPQDQEGLKERLQRFFAGITVPDSPRFDRK